MHDINTCLIHPLYECVFIKGVRICIDLMEHVVYPPNDACTTCLYVQYLSSI